MTLEEKLDRIRYLADEMEAGNISLEQSIDRYEEAAALIIACRNFLLTAELRIAEVKAELNESQQTGQRSGGTEDDEENDEETALDGE
jgi:exodeoxyribonuclease VII small subunit